MSGVNPLDRTLAADSDYLKRLKMLVEAEAEKLPGGFTELASKIGRSTQSLSNWKIGNIKTEIRDDAIRALSEHMKCDWRSLRGYLRTGDWEAEQTPPDPVVQRIERLEEDMKGVLLRLDRFTDSPEMPDKLGASTANGLSVALQRMLAEKLYEVLIRLGCDDSVMSFERLLTIVSGSILPNPPEQALLAWVLKDYTQNQGWTQGNIAALLSGQISAIPSNETRRNATEPPQLD